MTSDSPVSKCTGPIWSVDDVTSCFRHRYFQLVPVGLTGAISLAILVLTVLPHLKNLRPVNKDPAYQPLLADDSSEDTNAVDDDDELDYQDQDNHEYIRQTRTYGSIFNSSNASADPTDLTNEDPSDTKSTVIIATVVRSTSERVRVALELIAVAAQFTLSIAAIKVPAINGEWSEDSPNTPYVFAAFWAYALLLVLVRAAYINSIKVPAGGLWYHSTTIYVIVWLFSTIWFRSTLLHPFTDVSQKYYITAWLLSSALVILNFSAKNRDKAPRLYIRDGLTPSNEPVASLFQLITFSYIDKLVWDGYWKNLTLKDVWELREDDHAFHILKKFRKIKRSSGMALRMVKHFKFELFLAGCYALIFSLTIFGPAVLIKLILDYVENPVAPRGVAWLYVFAIFGSAIVDNIANGQALFIGRRICIRMRAIIIGEVYAKALRRKASSGETKGLGEKKEDKKKSAESDSEDSAADDKKSDDKKEENESTGQANLGSIINLMAIDAFKVSEICGYLHYFVGGVLQIVLAIFLLYKVLDWSAFVGAAAMILMMPLSYKFSEKFAEYQNELMKITDKRVEKTNELLQSIRIIKYFGWEEKFAQGVLDIREQELRVLRNRYILWCFGALIWSGTPLCVTIMSFFSYTVIQGKVLTAPIAFTAMTLFNIMRVPMDQLADMLSNVLQSKVSIDRIDEFLAEDETTKYKQLGKHSVRGPNSPYIGFEQASFSWGGSKDNANAYNFKLRELTVSFPIGQLSVIVGPTGSGKTSLLMALLGEMDLDEGRVFLPGAESREDVKVDPTTGLQDTVAYCSQQAWLLNDTLKSNILFASEYDEARYNAVIEACSLSRDLEILDAGDETEVGEKGITLSGGQKQRISLARAMYSRAKHLILDDCLSAVDSHTALAIYENCLTGPIAENRSIILVSHNVALTISKASFVVVMENGRIKTVGTPTEVAATGALGDDELIKNSASQSASQGTSRAATRVSSAVNLLDIDKKKSKSLGKEVAKRLADNRENKGIEQQTAGSDSENDAVEDDEEALKKEQSEFKKKKLIQEEAISEGSIDATVYIAYAKAMGSWWFWGILLIFVQQGFQVAQSWWIREWTVKGMVAEIAAAAVYMLGLATGGTRANVNIPYQTENGNITALELGDEKPVYKHSTTYYLAWYFAIGLMNMAAVVIKEGVMFWGGLQASRGMFEQLLNSVLSAKTRFFDATPIGRIINRFSKDVEGIDQEMSPVAAGFLHCLITCLTTALVIAYITPGFLIAGVFIMTIYAAIAVFYLASSRNLKRIDSVSKSPIYQHFGETLVGVSTIRAYGDQRRFVRENLKKIDDNNRPFFYLWVANRWLSFRVDSAGALVSFGAAAFVILSIGHIDAGLAGLSLSYALVFNEIALWVVRLYAMVEVNANSVERIIEYTTLDSEAPRVIEDFRPPYNWPSNGEIEFKNLSLRYAENLPLVIKDVSFKVEPFHKIGIVGRTGAGKSTIITALFRFLEADAGSIVIDGIDISKLGLRDLRQALAIIPQDPTLFAGTIRSNLDPFSQYSDAQIFEALRRVHLISETPVASSSSSTTPSDGDENRNQFLNLDTIVSEGGSNLSQGQRQLMCLARSLLKSPRVLLLDEATASIDYETDARIQETIRKEFGQTTLLTIAHRLRSIIDYDKILVMDAGEIKEYDKPHTLLQDKNSIFRDMCVKSGELDALEQLAEQAFNKTS